MTEREPEQGVLFGYRPDGTGYAVKRTKREGYQATCSRCGAILARFALTKLEAMHEAAISDHDCSAYDIDRSEIPFG